MLRSLHGASASRQPEAIGSKNRVGAEVDVGRIGSGMCFINMDDFTHRGNLIFHNEAGALRKSPGIEINGKILFKLFE
jgi:hypothetical protein